MQFNKLSIHPPWTRFFLRPPTPLDIYLRFLAFETLPPPGIFNVFCWGSMDIFWNHTISIQVSLLTVGLVFSLKKLSHWVNSWPFKWQRKCKTMFLIHVQEPVCMHYKLKLCIPRAKVRELHGQRLCNSNLSTTMLLQPWQVLQVMGSTENPVIISMYTS